MVTATDPNELPNILQQSQQSFEYWSSLMVGERVAYIHRFLTEYITHRDQVAQATSLEIGKAITHSYADVDYDI